MSVMLNNERTDAKRPQLYYRRDAISGSRDLAPDRRHVTQMAAEDKEMAFVARCAFALAFLGVAPLILFLIVHYYQLWF